MKPAAISSIEGNRQWLDGGAMFGNAPRPVWEKWLTPDEKGRIPLACRSLLIETGTQKILCETGIGAFFEPKLAERYGVEDGQNHRLLHSLAQLGLSDSDIDIVILSHLHFDHAGGLLPTYSDIEKGNRDLLFPRARYVVGREAWARAINPHPRDRASFIPGLTEQLESSGRLILVDGAKHKELPDQLSFFYTSGHTPGQMHTQFQGTQSQVIFAGDLIPGRAWVHVPITMGYDRFPELLIDEKTQLYERIADQNCWIFFTHDPEKAMAKIARDVKGKYEAHDAHVSAVRLLI
jgi:glyoxylase-like metal-dependent hydrolase (beta-lactamase superfamily II)